MFNQKGGAKTDTVVKLVFIFFISLLSFSVGTFVGKQVSDSDYKRLALEDEYKGHDKETADAGHGKADEHGVSEEEVTSLTDEFVKSEKEAEHGEEAEHAERDVASKHDEHGKADKNGYKKIEKDPHAAPAAHEPEEAHDAKDEHAAADEHAPKDAHAAAAPHGKKMPAPSEAANRVAEGKSATKTETAPRQPNSVLPSVAGSAIGKYTVQVASYPDEEEARTHAAGLKGKGWNAFYVPASVNGKTWFRVSVGLFPDQKSALSFRTEFMKETNAANTMVQKIVQ